MARTRKDGTLFQNQRKRVLAKQRNSQKEHNSPYSLKILIHTRVKAALCHNPILNLLSLLHVSFNDVNTCLATLTSHNHLNVYVSTCPPLNCNEMQLRWKNHTQYAIAVIVNEFNTEPMIMFRWLNSCRCNTHCLRANHKAVSSVFTLPAYYKPAD